MLHLCIYHAKMGTALAEYVAPRCPTGVRVSAVTDVTVDPPQLDTIDALVAFRFPDGLLTRLPRLRWLQLTTAGIDQAARAERPPELLVTHAGSIPVRAVTEFVLMGILSLARNVPALLRQHDARVWRQPGARLIEGATLLLIGLGRIGSEIARTARALGMRVIAATRSGQARVEVERCVTGAELAAVMPQADYVAVCVPAADDTIGLVDQNALSQLKPGACVIDVSRPGVVDHDALLAALRTGTCQAAILDVHEHEPLPSSHPLWDEPGVWITPHCAFEQDREIERLGQLICKNLGHLLAARPLENLAKL